MLVIVLLILRDHEEGSSESIPKDHEDNDEPSHVQEYSFDDIDQRCDLVDEAEVVAGFGVNQKDTEHL